MRVQIVSGYGRVLVFPHLQLHLQSNGHIVHGASSRCETLLFPAKCPIARVCRPRPVTVTDHMNELGIHYAGPRWASATLGTFVCIRCSGIHRNLGVHISFVRSVSLDEWQTKHVKQMVRWGNKRANEFWEATVPDDYYIPDENDSVANVERWIREKYEKKRFVAKTLPAWAEQDIDLSLPFATLLAGRGMPAKKKTDGASAGAGGKLKAPSGSGMKVLAPTATPVAAPVAAAVEKAAPTPAPSIDLLGFDSFPTAPAVAPTKAASLEADFAMFSMSTAPSPAPAPVAPHHTPHAPSGADFLNMYGAPPAAPAPGYPTSATHSMSVSAAFGFPAPQPAPAGYGYGAPPHGAPTGYGMPTGYGAPQAAPYGMPTGYGAPPQGAYGGPATAMGMGMGMGAPMGGPYSHPAPGSAGSGTSPFGAFPGAGAMPASSTGGSVPHVGAHNPFGMPAELSKPPAAPAARDPFAEFGAM